jgi:hypothetical protein
VWRQTLGEDHERTATVKRNLADLLALTGAAGGCEQLAREALGASKRRSRCSFAATRASRRRQPGPPTGGPPSPASSPSTRRGASRTSRPATGRRMRHLRRRACRRLRISSGDWGNREFKL